MDVPRRVGSGPRGGPEVALRPSTGPEAGHSPSREWKNGRTASRSRSRHLYHEKGCGGKGLSWSYYTDCGRSKGPRPAFVLSLPVPRTTGDTGVCAPVGDGERGCKTRPVTT